MKGQGWKERDCNSRAVAEMGSAELSGLDASGSRDDQGQEVGGNRIPKFDRSAGRIWYSTGKGVSVRIISVLKGG